jgi:hypothetical protein
MRSTRRLAVLEADWFAGYNHTVRPFFEGMSRNLYETTDGFWYERFVGRASLEDSMRYLVGKRDVRYLYLATHGERTYIKCPNKDRIKRPDFDQIFGRAIEGTRLDGVYFASCLFGTRKTAELLWSVGETRWQRLKWVAGYTLAVDWMESMALDWLFWNKLLEREHENDSEAPIARVQAVVDYLVELAPNLCRTLQFHVYVRKTGSGEIADLVWDKLNAK